MLKASVKFKPVDINLRSYECVESCAVPPKYNIQLPFAEHYFNYWGDKTENYLANEAYFYEEWGMVALLLITLNEPGLALLVSAIQLPFNLR